MIMFALRGWVATWSLGDQNLTCLSEHGLSDMKFEYWLSP